LTFTVVAEDQFNNTATGYSGTVTYSSSDTAAGLPTPRSLAAGTGTFSATLQTHGTQTITATDGTITGASNSVNVTTTVLLATHLLVNAPGNATAGAGFTFTVTAETAANTTAISYTGTVTFTSTDTGASTLLPTPATLVAGVGIFSVTLTTKGGQTLTAADAANALRATSATITVSAAAASHFVVSAPATTVAGNNLIFTVVAEDRFNNTATGYNGTATFSSTDTGASTKLPVSSALVSGVGTFSATLTTKGSQTLVATDGTITGTSGTIAVSAAAASRFVVSAPATTVAGNNLTFTVVAEDKFNNTATGYTGTATFTSTDSNASTKLPIPSPLVSGVGNFSATLTTAGNQTLTATSGTVTGSSGPIAVSAAAASRFVISAPATTVAGNNVTFTVAAEDKFNNTATVYTGIPIFTSTDTGASTKLPAPSPLAAGVGAFSATLTTAGSQRLTATDGTITGTSGPIAVSAAAASHFVVSAPATTMAGNNLTFTVLAEDKFNNTATGYNGTVTFTSTDIGASTKLPAPSPLTAGVGTFSATLTTKGSQTLTATDAPNALTGTIGPITVTAAAASHFVVTAPATTVAGNNLTFTVLAEDKFNNTATGYSGTVTFTSTDSNASTRLPAASPLSAGLGTFSATLTTAGSQKLTATDGTITGTSGTITVSATTASHFVIIAPATAVVGTPFIFTVVAEDQFNNIATGFSGTATFTSTDTGTSTTLPAAGPLSAGVGIFSATLTTAGGQTLTATDGSLTGTSATITVSTTTVGRRR